jgi:c-di-GMP-binding flagellar brake protein YcgR
MQMQQSENVVRARPAHITLSGSDSVELYLLGKVFYSRVIDADNTMGLVKVHGPSEKNRLVTVPIDTIVEIGIGRLNDGYYRTRAKVVGATTTPDPMLVLAVDAERTQRVERRSYFRITMPVEIEYQFNENTGEEDLYYPARLSNISGGGLLFHDEKLLGAPLHTGDLMQVRLRLPSSDAFIQVIGTVVHRRPNAGGVPGLALRFITDNRTQDRIIRHIFEFERRHLLQHSA